MSGISTHVLDTSAGRPAAGVGVTLDRWELDAWVACASRVTDADGRCGGLLESVAEARYRLRFAMGEYFAETIFPEVVVVFEAAEDGGSFHVPLLVSPFGYTTYRGT